MNARGWIAQLLRQITRERRDVDARVVERLEDDQRRFARNFSHETSLLPHHVAQHIGSFDRRGRERAAR